MNLNPTVTITNNKFENMDKTPFEDAIYLKFDHEGPLPGKAEIELDISNNNIYEKGKTVYLYYYDSTKKEYQYLNALIVGDKKITITLDHCSEYVISDKLLANAGENEKPTQDPELVDKNKNPNKPDTGDNSNIDLWGALMTISLVGIVVCVASSNKKEKHK